MYKINMKTSQLHQLHNKQWVCALPRKHGLPRAVCPLVNPAKGPALEDTQWQGSDVTAFLGEKFNHLFFFGNFPKMGQQRVLW